MYTYLFNYPSDREMGWSHELQGVCHDDNNWFFTQNGNIWKFPLSHDLNKQVKKPSDFSGVIKNSYGGYRLGDCDCYGGYLFVPVSLDGSPYIAVFDASNLSYIAKTRLDKFGKKFSLVHWCAINPKDGLLYTSDHNVGNDFTDDTSPVMVYEIDFEKIRDRSDNFLVYKTFLRLYNATGDRLSRDFVQGGCFDNENHLHINNGDYTIKGGSHNYANDKGGISVFYIPDIPKTGAKPCYRVKRIACSNQSKGFQYQFNGTGEEPSGITYWDLRNKKVGGKVKGCLHAIMSDNNGRGDDDLYFKHYDRVSVTNTLPTQAHQTKLGVIITAEDSDGASSFEAKRRKKNQELIAGLYKNRGIDYTIIENIPKSGVEKILGAIFYNQISRDSNYIYINCHGNENGLCLGYDRTKQDYFMYYTRLKGVLDKISGKHIIMIEACHSGSATPLRSPNSFIIASALSDESSDGDTVLGNWATRYWACGAGYDFLPGQKHDMEADSNKDNKVTLNELLKYTNGKLKLYSRQNRCVMISDYPDTVIFE